MKVNIEIYAKQVPANVVFRLNEDGSIEVTSILIECEGAMLPVIQDDLVEEIKDQLIKGHNEVLDRFKKKCTCDPDPMITCAIHPVNRPNKTRKCR